MIDEEVEKEANTFAAAFLMLEKLFRQVWKEKNGRGRGTIQSVADCGQMASGWIRIKRILAKLEE